MHFEFCKLNLRQLLPKVVVMRDCMQKKKTKCLHECTGDIMESVRRRQARQSFFFFFHFASTVSHRLERKHASISLFGCIACMEGGKKKKTKHTQPLCRQTNRPWAATRHESSQLMWLPGFGQDDFLARSGRWSRFALLHRHQITDIGEHRFEVRHLSTLGRANQ